MLSSENIHSGPRAEVIKVTYMDMGLINKVDMVCLSPVGYGV